MDLLDYQYKLAAKIESIEDRRARCAVLVYIAEMLQPYYHYFVRDTGEPHRLEYFQQLELLWQAILHEKLPEKIKFLQKQIEEGIPDLDDFSSMYTTSAQDAGICVAYAVEHFNGKDNDRIKAIISRSNEVYEELDDMLVQGSNPKTKTHCHIIETDYFASIERFADLLLAVPGDRIEWLKVVRASFRSEIWFEYGLLHAKKSDTLF